MCIFKVAIIGAGPAGCSAAATLARAGIQTILLEKSAVPRHKTCGGGIVLRAHILLQKLLHVDIDPVIDQQCSSIQLNFNDLNLFLNMTHRHPLVSTVQREKFDYFLMQKAGEYGAMAKKECTVEKIVQDKHHINLQTSAGQIKADWIILAEGAHNHLASAAGWTESRLLIPAVETQLILPSESLHGFSETTRFDFGSIPNGYAWIFPKKDHLSVGALCMSSKYANLRKNLELYIKKVFGEHIYIDKVNGFFIPIRPRQDTFVKERILLVGDSAGFADPICGEGISNAVLSSHLASRALIQTDFNPELAGKVYTRYLNKYILKDLRIAGKIAHLFYFYPRFRSGIIKRFSNELVQGMISAFSGHRTYSDMIYSPRSYLKLMITHIKKITSSPQERSSFPSS